MAFFAGPPCESWSRSRQLGGIPTISSGDNGPRLLRLAEQPLGLPALTTREVQQLQLANRLLLFVLSAFLEMVLLCRFAMIEHPASPEEAGEEWLPSIWKLYVTQCLASHPWVQQIQIAQGWYGAKSPKPTTLLFGCGRDLPVERILQEGRTHSMPKALQMGREGGEYSTAALKNYPSSLCRAMATVLERWLSHYMESLLVVAPTHLPDHAVFADYVQHLLVHFNFDALRGADCAL